MIWNKTNPRLGEYRKKTKFAWLPCRVNGKYIVWLEYYISMQQFRQVIHYCGNGMAVQEYIKHEWVELDTHLYKK